MHLGILGAKLIIACKRVHKKSINYIHYIFNIFYNIFQLIQHTAYFDHILLLAMTDDLLQPLFSKAMLRPPRPPAARVARREAQARTKLRPPLVQSGTSQKA